jgi:molybdate transport system substrate-binding protein
MIIERRRVLQASAVLPLAAMASAAKAATTDIVLNCDTALAPVMTAAASRFYQRSSVRVRVFATGPGLILPQLARQIQNDLICTRRDAMDAAVSSGLVAAGASRGAWRNRLVIGTRAGAGPAAVQGRIAVSDPTPASDMDGPAIIDGLGLGQAAVLGVIDTDEVAFLLLRGQADAGLLHLTDIHANPGLAILRTVPDGAAARPITYSIAVTKLARRPAPQAFVAFLMAPEGGAVLRSFGLEAAA